MKVARMRPSAPNDIGTTMNVLRAWTPRATSSRRSARVGRRAGVRVVGSGGDMAGPVIVIARGARAGLLGSGRAFEGLRAFLGGTGAFGGGAEMLAHGRGVGARVVQRAP